jgi:hypothetical protein
VRGEHRDFQNRTRRPQANQTSLKSDPDRLRQTTQDTSDPRPLIAFNTLNEDRSYTRKEPSAANDAGNITTDEILDIWTTCLIPQIDVQRVQMPRM